MAEEIEVEKFNDLVLDMYRGFPNYIYSGVENIIISESVRRKLVEKDFLMEDSSIENGERRIGYMLGPNMLPLISSWKNESLAEKIKNLTIIIVCLTVVLICVAILSFFKM
ncbi:MAG: hypothetical protein NTW30_05745 [Candidatus Aenigmarchaeota archaeon]|nr:hypothetical protein [Candidatus Aenigmarchaeota archaeon]